MSENASVCIVDDNPGVRSTLRAILESEGIRVESYDSAEHFLRDSALTKPSCLLLDIRLPGMSGLELQSALSKRGPLPPIIFITGAADVSSAVRAMKAGAVDFIEKPLSAPPVLRSVRDALAGEETRRDDSARAQEWDEGFVTLTQRQRQVLNGLIAGQQNKELARDLRISPRTVEIHRSQAMRKMGVRNLAELVHKASGAGITSSRS